MEVTEGRGGRSCNLQLQRGEGGGGGDFISDENESKSFKYFLTNIKTQVTLKSNFIL